jgi:hypothetical protein
VHGLIAQSPSGAWSSGGAILTFVLPMLLFIVVAVGLYIWYTKPSVVPGRRAPAGEHPVSYTSIPGNPIAPEVPGSPPASSARPDESRNARENEATGTEGPQ